MIYKKNQLQILKNAEIGKKYQIFGKITNINKGDNFYNVDVLLTENEYINIKIENINLTLMTEKIYIFEVIKYLKQNKYYWNCENVSLIENILDLEQIYQIYSCFFTCAPLSFDKADFLINKYIAAINNSNLKKITTILYNKYRIPFLISPAAFKMHHNYYGGLAYHTTNMLQITLNLVERYNFLNLDLLYAGIILHDMFKVKEFNFAKKEYTKEGVLLGHLVLSVNYVHEEAFLLNIQDTEEILLLKHLLISHHGLLEYGALKTPQTGEAFLLWHLDNIDAKLTSLGEMFAKTSEGSFSEPLAVFDKKSLYKHNL
ncbi:MAG: HD domain-containing protein [Candidatus Phytoplasma australasiaticum]|uniref:HD domain-containing protein n=2 Tax=16SrII (Peanut WB group) TaxID=85621 RepID=A0A9K3WT36_9MOLU|nr:MULTISPECIES: HD domain-containing protein [Phytoplasma]MCG3566867.1 HD domain-containing protein [Sesame phyllody phytoplasma]MDO8031274.1 HD domain-containing protein [Candidatus Phytoplasma australasiaticum]MDO8031661.1 HD domain-containing protein [Candidatus Phytoplasma australasiaticum]MDO8046761.1 HD domain-containing protein [Candidatus Phytoplasma australasiaticum]MDO8053286.1 HD domain-containing protein [Candidatus Phytoplasma australasiaticum]